MIRITPGHTSGSISVFVEGDRRYVMCGDAIPTRANYESMLPPAVHMDRKLALMSMDRILSWAEIVVPGHDPPFEVSEKSKTEKRYRSGI
jgi:glyoxylase-like metal-dependent hydrolase (beta-lactamase superfamily II)